jgi:hypothetical protein
MNDIYEYKARKYKHKYLKLKRKYSGEGGAFKKTLKTLQNLFKNDPKEMTEKEKSEEIDHRQPASDEQTSFKNKLILLKQNIEKDIKLSLYDKNKILGNKVYNLYTQDLNCILSDLNTIKCILNTNSTFSFNSLSMKTFDIGGEINMLDMYKIYGEIKNNVYDPPILKWFFELLEIKSSEEETKMLEANVKRRREGWGKDGIWTHKIQNTNITKKELFESLELFLKNKENSKQILEDFTNDFKSVEISLSISDSKEGYRMNDIFNKCIRNKSYIKNIDFYSLTIYICKLYEIFTKYFKIVEDTSKSQIRLPQLFKNFKEKFDNNSIEVESFFKDLDLIISVIK